MDGMRATAAKAKILKRQPRISQPPAERPFDEAMIVVRIAIASQTKINPIIAPVRHPDVPLRLTSDRELYATSISSREAQPLQHRLGSLATVPALLH